ncbi:MAG: DNA replication protein DnaD, partial [Clostridia bacterium]|nr:DNA replication protein DnaD [Clostridia bacterium]
MPTFNANFNYVPVSREFIENYMPPANGAYVKVYLYALSLGYDGLEMSNAEIARVLNLVESDVVNALKFWQEEGL